MSFLLNPSRFGGVVYPFPTVQSRTTRANAARGISQSILLPPDFASGDLGIITIGGQYIGSAQSWNTPTGWELQGQSSGTPTANSFYSVGWFARVMDGTENGSIVTFSLDGSGNFTVAAEIIRIAAASWYGTLTDGLSKSAITNTVDTDNPSFATCTPLWGAANTLWIASGGAADDDGAWIGASPGYGNLQSIVSGAGADNGCSVGSCERELNAASETPGVMTLSTGESWRTMVLAVRPTA